MDGVQGRYFTPIAVFLPCLLPPRRGPAGWRLRGPALPALCALAVFPLASIVATVEAVVVRYYG